MAKKAKTEKEKEIEKELSTYNNKFRWFYIHEDFEAKFIILKKGWYEMVGTRITMEGNCNHDIKLKDSKDYFLISETDYLKALNQFRELNKHLELR